MKKLLLILFVGALLTACDSMDANYIEYLQNAKQYSPRVTNLTAEVPKEGKLILNWTNPIGETAVKIRIDIDENQLIIDEMIKSYTIENLKIKNYTISVYTIDRYGNLSVPMSVLVFPKPEE